MPNEEALGTEQPSGSAVSSPSDDGLGATGLDAELGATGATQLPSAAPVGPDEDPATLRKRLSDTQAWGTKVAQEKSALEDEVSRLQQQVASAAFPPQLAANPGAYGQPQYGPQDPYLADPAGYPWDAPPPPAPAALPPQVQAVIQAQARATADMVIKDQARDLAESEGVKITKDELDKIRETVYRMGTPDVALAYKHVVGDRIAAERQKQAVDKALNDARKSAGAQQTPPSGSPSQPRRDYPNTVEGRKASIEDAVNSGKITFEE